MAYGIIEETIFDSAITGYGIHTTYVFMAMIALANEEHICDYGVHALASKLMLSVDELNEIINHLSSPDTESKRQDFEGRRIVPLSELDDIESNRGWFIVNREYYISEIKRKSRFNKAKDAMKKHRASKAAKKLKVAAAQESEEAAEDPETKENDAKEFKVPTTSEVREECKIKGYDVDPESFVAFYESKGWMVGRQKMKSWKAALITWEKRNDSSNNKKTMLQETADAFKDHIKNS